METEVLLKRRVGKKEELARPIRNERDYREAKKLLSLTMRSPRTPESAERADALLEAILAYETRIEAEDSDGLNELYAALDEHDSPRRRWSDQYDE